MAFHKERSFSTATPALTEDGFVCLDVPKEIARAMRFRGRALAAGTLNGVSMEFTLYPNGRGSHFVLLSADDLSRASLSPGALAQITLSGKREPRLKDLPLDLKHALNANPKAKAAFESFSPSHRKAHLEHIEEARKPFARSWRIEQTIQRLCAR